MKDDTPLIEISQRAVFDLIADLTGQDRKLTIPRTFIEWLDGDHLAALMLSQVLYWSSRTRDPEGWFYKSAKGWEIELAMSQYQQTRAIKKLAIAGVETKLKKANGAPTVHYRISQPVFSKWIMEKLENRPDPITEKLENGFRESSEIDLEETRESLPTEITSEITQKTDDPLNSSIDGMPAASVWIAVLDEIATDGSIRATDLTGFLKPAHLIGARPDGVLVLQAANAPAQRRIEGHLRSDIERIIGRWLGRPVRIEVTH